MLSRGGFVERVSELFDSVLDSHLKIKRAQLSQNSWFSSGLFRLFKLPQCLPYTPVYIAMFVSCTSDAYLGHILRYSTLIGICSHL